MLQKETGKSKLSQFFYHHGVDHFVAKLNAWKK